MDRAGEGEAQEGLAARVAPAVDAHQGLGAEMPGGLLQGLPDHRLEQGFAVLQVPGRLVQAQAAVHLFLHHQESPVPFHHGGHGGPGSPGAGGGVLVG